jgi:hypothetical protein
MSWVITGTQKIAPDPYRSNVSLLLHGDGTNGSTTIIDSSPSPKTVTAVGNAQISTAQSKFGGASIAFDGNGDTLSVQANSAFEFGTGDFTWEAWVYLNTLETVNGLYYYGSGNNNRLQILVQTNGSFSFYAETGPFVEAASSASAVSATTWTHLAGTRSGNTFRCFVNGVLSGTDTGALILPSAQTPVIGNAVTGNAARNLNGYIDDLRITKGVARYTSNFTPPTAPFPDF